MRNDFNQCKFTYYMNYYKTSNLRSKLLLMEM
nr:MAG TPA: hypothetical protein [Crassvirales sp.]